MFRRANARRSSFNKHAITYMFSCTLRTSSIAVRSSISVARRTFRHSTLPAWIFKKQIVNLQHAPPTKHRMSQVAQMRCASTISVKQRKPFAAQRCRRVAPYVALYALALKHTNNKELHVVPIPTNEQIFDNECRERKIFLNVSLLLHDLEPQQAVPRLQNHVHAFARIC